jgi:hypothetical protein
MKILTTIGFVLLMSMTGLAQNPGLPTGTRSPPVSRQQLGSR